MLKKDFLLSLHEDWTRQLALLNAELAELNARDSDALKVARAGKAAEWVAHYAQLLRDGHGVCV